MAAYTTEQLETLAEELTVDPLARGYSGMGDEEAANRLNVEDRTAPLESISPATFLHGMVETEFEALTAAQRQYLGLALGNGPIDIREGSEIRVALLAFFGAQSQTRANLLASLDRTASRVEELGLPAPVTPTNVADARDL